jgi:hypothetical protein
MKKYILFSLLFAFVSSNLFAKKIIIRKEGSPDGIHYDKVRETHSNPWIGEDTHRLICLNGGSIECNWQHSPWILGNTQNFDFYDFLAIYESRIKTYFAENPSKASYYEVFITDGIKVTVNAWHVKGSMYDYEIEIIDKE